MTSLRALLFILAFLCFVLDALGVSSRVRLQSVGLALWVLGVFV